MPKKNTQKITKKSTKKVTQKKAENKIDDEISNYINSYTSKNTYNPKQNMILNKSVPNNPPLMINLPDNNDTVFSDDNSIEPIANDVTDTMALIQDKNGTIYMGIHNFYNCFCYFISAVQRLHSSASLRDELKKDLFSKERLSDSIETHEISEKIMSIIRNYNKIHEIFGDKPISPGVQELKVMTGGDKEIHDKISQIYDSMFEYKKVIDELFHENLKHGGDPQGILLYLFLPIIFHYTDEYTFLNILKELNFSTIHFGNTIYDPNVFQVIKDGRENYNKKLQEWYSDILKYIDKNKNEINEEMFENQFCATTLCIYFASVYKRDYSSNAGHAVTLVYGNDNEFYIIDDHKNIKQMDEYIKLKYSNIYELEFKDLTKEIIEKMAKWKPYTVDNRIYRTVLRPKTEHAMGNHIKENYGMNGGKKNNGFDVIDYSVNFKTKPTMYDVYKWMSVKYKSWFNLYYAILIVLIITLLLYVIRYLRSKFKLSKTNKEIETKKKRLKHLQKKNDMTNLSLNSIESKSKEMAENFTSYLGSNKQYII